MSERRYNCYRKLVANQGFWNSFYYFLFLTQKRLLWVNLIILFNNITINILKGKKINANTRYGILGQKCVRRSCTREWSATAAWLTTTSWCHLTVESYMCGTCACTRNRFCWIAAFLRYILRDRSLWLHGKTDVLVSFIVFCCPSCSSLICTAFLPLISRCITFQDYFSQLAQAKINPSDCATWDRFPRPAQLGSWNHFSRPAQNDINSRSLQTATSILTSLRIITCRIDFAVRRPRELKSQYAGCLNWLLRIDFVLRGLRELISQCAGC